MVVFFVEISQKSPELFVFNAFFNLNLNE